MPLVSAGVWIDDDFRAVCAPVTLARFERSRPSPTHPPEFWLKEADAFHTPYRGWAGELTNTGPRRAIEYLKRTRLQAAIVLDASLSQWPDPFDANLTRHAVSRVSPLRGFDRGPSLTVDQPEIELGENDLASSAGAGAGGDFGTGTGWVAATANFRRVQFSAAKQWSWSFPERIPDLPQEMLVTLTRMGVHSLPVSRRAGPTTPPAYLDPGEFFSIVAFDTGGTTLPPRGPVLRRGFGADLAFGVFVASPELTAHIGGEVTAPARPSLRVVRQTIQALPLDSDFLGPLPAAFVFSPQAPTLLLRGPRVATDGTLRELPDSTEAIQEVWESKPQAPVRPLARTSQTADSMARDVWFDALGIDVLLPWAGAPQAPMRPLERRYPETATATFQVWMPLGDPMAWDVGPQPRTLPRPGPTKHEYTSAPDLYSSGISIVIPGPYYAIQGGIWCAGSVAGVIATE